MSDRKSYPYYLLPQARLARKIYVLSDRTAVAVSGDDINRIKDFLENLRPLIEVAESQERPGRFIGDFANQIGQIGVISVTIIPREIGYSISSCSQTPMFPTNNLGDCAAIGSGASELVRLTKDWDALLEAGPTETLRFPQELIRGFAAAHCNEAIVQQAEILRRRQNPRTWGSFFEYAVYDDQERGWWRGPSRLLLFFQAYVINGTPVAAILPTCLAYDPSNIHGRIFAMYCENENRVLAHEYILDDLLNPITADVERHEDVLERWADWQPEIAVITVMPPPSQFSPKIVTTSTEYWQKNEVYFALGSHYSNYGISDRLLSDILAKCNKIWQVEKS